MAGCIIVMRGLPGSGKSFLAQKIAKQFDAPIISTDDYWLRPDGQYDFNYDLIKDAHNWNLGRLRKCLERKDYRIVVDNVHAKFSYGIKEYVQLANVFQYKMALIEPQTEWAFNVEECYIRNKHGVPYSTILRMYHDWEPSDDIYDEIDGYDVGINFDLVNFIQEKLK